VTALEIVGSASAVVSIGCYLRAAFIVVERAVDPDGDLLVRLDDRPGAPAPCDPAEHKTD
jgi:hypothetical protein